MCREYVSTELRYRGRHVDAEGAQLFIGFDVADLAAVGTFALCGACILARAGGCFAFPSG